jgi:hypothetical protein
VERETGNLDELGKMAQSCLTLRRARRMRLPNLARSTDAPTTANALRDRNSASLRGLGGHRTLTHSTPHCNNIPDRMELLWSSGLNEHVALLFRRTVRCQILSSSAASLRILIFSSHVQPCRPSCCCSCSSPPPPPCFRVRAFTNVLLS